MTMIEPNWRADWDALDAIWKRIDSSVSRDTDLTVSSDMIRAMVFELADERDRLQGELVQLRGKYECRGGGNGSMNM